MLGDCTIASFAAIQVSFDRENYTVTEGGSVNITLVTNTIDYEFDFTVTLQPVDGSAIGESCSMTSCAWLCSSLTAYHCVPLLLQ